MTSCEYVSCPRLDLGSTSLETDATGNILNNSLFFPYGQERVIAQADTANNYKYTGKERDTETGLDDFGARYYDSSLGRFTTPDWDAKPASVPYASFGDPQTLNLYSYVENAPLNRVDADGHSPILNYTSDGLEAGQGQVCGGSGCGADAPVSETIKANLVYQATQDAESGQEATKGKPKLEAQQLAWSSLSRGQQGLVAGGEKSWTSMSAGAQGNFAAITHTLEGIKLPGGATGLSEVQSASMRANGREMDVAWKKGAAEAFMSTGNFSETTHLPTHYGVQVLRQNVGGIGQGMELIFPTAGRNESQAHIDYNRLGPNHFKADNDDVAAHKDVYKKLYGSLPGLIP